MSLLGSSLAEKVLGIVADSKLHVSQQRALSVKMVNNILGCMNSSIARRSQEGIILLYSALFRAQSASSFGALTQCKKGTGKLG